MWYKYQLCKVVGNVNSENQSAFSPQQFITGIILVAQEFLHGQKSKITCKISYMTLKFDASKAYDGIQWSFLKEMCVGLGFCQKWVEWIMCCVTTVT